MNTGVFTPQEEVHMTVLLRVKRNRSILKENSTLDFNEIFENHWERICAVLYRILGDWSEAEDLALETFFRLYSSPPEEKRNISGWLYRVATNLGLNAVRAQKRRLRYEEEAGKLSLQENQIGDPVAEIERSLERKMVRTVLLHIKPRSAQILILRYSGLKYVEIAEALEVSSGSVGTLLVRAEKEFQEAYNEFSTKKNGGIRTVRN